MRHKQGATKGGETSSPGASAGELDAAELGRRVAELKRRLMDRSISTPIEYFHDHIANVAGFLSFGVVAADSRLERALLASVQRVLPAFEHASSQTFFIAEHGMWHGIAWGKRGEAAVFVYFTDSDVGVAQVAPSLGGRPSYCVRFTMLNLDGPMLPGPVQRGQA